MTGAEYIEAERIRKSGRIPEYTQEYEDAKKKAEHRERWCWRNWLRMLICFAPTSIVWILMERWSILWVFKFVLYVACMCISSGFYAHTFNRAVQKRLDTETQARKK